MATPQSTPIRQAKLGIASSKSMPLTNEYKKLFSDQHQRLAIKHQQDLDLIDDIRSYVKARLSIERDYTTAMNKLAKSHSSHINKKFTLLNQCDHPSSSSQSNLNNNNNSNTQTHDSTNNHPNSSNHNDDQSNPSQQQQQQYRFDPPEGPSSLYKVWSEHINRLQVTSKNRSDQFQQLILIVDKLKDIRSHKALIGKKCLDTHLKRIHEDLMVSMAELERARKLYNEDESQAKKARENEEKFKKKRSGLLTKFTDLQAKKEKSSAQREATDIQSTQARNDYIMALAAANAHLKQYYHRDMTDFIQLIDDGVLDHCKIFMATLSECEINSLKDSLQHAQYWSKLINSSGSQQTNYIFLDCQQSWCLRPPQTELPFEAYNNDPIHSISLEHNADYALQHEVDKWFTWFKKECRNLSQLMHFLDTCQHAFTEGKRSIEWNGQTIENLEGQIIELKQQIRKSEAAKLKAQARLRVIKEGGMQIEEWSSVELEIRADMARAQEEEALRAKRLKEMASQKHSTSSGGGGPGGESSTAEPEQHQHHRQQVQLQISKDSDLDSNQEQQQQVGHEPGGGGGESMHNLASVSRSTSNLMQKQQNAISGYSALTDPSLVWQDDYSNSANNAWGPQNLHQQQQAALNADMNNEDQQQQQQQQHQHQKEAYDGLLSTKQNHHHHQQQTGQQQQQQQPPNTSVSIQSSSPLSAIVNNQHLSNSPYQVGLMSEAYKSDYECDYNTKNGHLMMRSSAASSAELPATATGPNGANNHHVDPFGKPLDELAESFDGSQQAVGEDYNNNNNNNQTLLNKTVVALYNFDKNNDDDLAFNENDVLLVVELVQDDPNWLRARNEATGDEGYIPASYVRLLEESERAKVETIEANDASDWPNNNQTGGDNFDNEQQQQQLQEDSVQYCRALYDHQPEADTYEEDGLPHLALVQGELFRIIDQGEDDGWWLVEQRETGVRGHVPSILVEEVDDEMEGQEEEEEDDDDDGDRTEIDDDELESTPGPPPDFEPPKLEAPQLVTDDDDQQQQRQVADEEAVPASSKQHINANDTQTINSLVPTSFIIIEPTPEVESKRIEDRIGEQQEAEEIDDQKKDDDNNNKQYDAQEGNSSQDTRNNTTQPARSSANSSDPNSTTTAVSYCVINEDFVLEKPTRKPHQFNQMMTNAGEHHETPTIIEESTPETTDDSRQQPVERTSSAAANYEPLSEVDSVTEMGGPAPPSVVIDSFEEDPKDRFGDSFDEDDHHQSQDRQGDQSDQDVASDYDQQQSSQSSQVSQKAKPIKHTGNVDISPILRHRADEFSRQIIEEAIMLAPGADIGPSTSSASPISMNNDDGEDANDDQQHNYNGDFSDEEA